MKLKLEINNLADYIKLLDKARYHAERLAIIMKEINQMELEVESGIHSQYEKLENN